MATKRKKVKKTVKKASAKKTSVKKTSTKKAPAKKTTAKKAAAKKPTAAKKAGAKASKKAAPAKKKPATNKKSAAKKKPAAKISVVEVSKSGKAVKAADKKEPAKKEAVKKEAAKKEATPAPAPAAKGGLGMRSQPVEVQAIDVRMGRAKDSRLPDYQPRSYGKAPKKPTVKTLQETLAKFLGRSPTPPAKEKGFTLVEIGIFCIFAIGRTSAKDAAEATKRVVKAFPDWNEFRISDAFELVEILDDLKIENLFDRCEQVLEFVNEVYNDQNFVDLEYLRELPVEDRLALLGRFQSIPASMTHYLALAIQDFEGFLFHYSWARVVQRVGIVPRSGSPRKLVESATKIFKGVDTVSLQVQLIDLGEEICISKNPQCKTCYLVLHCKSRKV